MLPHIDVPTTVISGGRDGMTPSRVAREMVAHVAHARLVQVAEATHVLPIEDPATVVAEIRATVAAAGGTAHD